MPVYSDLVITIITENTVYVFDTFTTEYIKSNLIYSVLILYNNNNIVIITNIIFKTENNL